MTLWSDGPIRAPKQSTALVGFAAALGIKRAPVTPEPVPPCVGCGPGVTPVETKAAGGADKNRGGAEQLRAYWVHGAGAAKIGWNTPGDFDRCVAELAEHMGERAKGYCNLRHHDATGGWPGDHSKGYTPQLETKAWDEALHPRNPDGAGGGEFKPKDSGEQGKADRRELSDEDRTKIHDLIDDLTGDGNRSDLTTEQRRAIKTMIDGLVDPTSKESDADPRRPFQDIPDTQRTALRDLVDKMTGDGRFKDLPNAARQAILTTVRGLSGPEPAKRNAKKGAPFLTGDGTLQYKSAAPVGDPMADGVMVALYAPHEVAADHAMDGGTPPAEMHVTLAYLGKVGDVPDPRVLHDVVAGYADAQPPVDGKISGVGRFVGGPDGDPLYLSVDAPTLPEVRAGLVAALEDAGLNVRKDHGFTPHITLGYLDPAAPMPVESVEPATASFGLLSVAYGPDVWDYPMGGTT